MSLNSFQFLIYFLILISIIAIIQNIKKYISNKKLLGNVQLLLLLIFSYLFIYINSWKFCLCILLYTICIYFLGKKIRNNSKYLVIGILVSILMLGYFKYTNFFIKEFSNLFKKDFTYLNIILPLGISFYTFSGIAYLVDIYRGEYEAKKDFLELGLYISFFPKITAGPIVRGKVFFSQYEDYRGADIAHFYEGIQIFVFGLFKKIVLADRLNLFVNDVFSAPLAFNTSTIILAIISYSLQIYYDFSGYSDMAIGISKICGFDFKKNFNLPYIAKGMSDFWKRWHISLSSWFQDYLYIPLGGSRKNISRTYINLVIVMVISGLWHGAGVTYIVWGFLHGLASCVSRVLHKKRQKNNKILDCFDVIITFVVTSLLWVVFRAKDLKNAIDIYNGVFIFRDGISQMYSWSFFAIFCFIISTIIAIVVSKRNNSEQIDGFYPVMDLNKIVSLSIFIVFCGITIMLGYFGDTAFIYGKF